MNTNRLKFSIVASAVLGSLSLSLVSAPAATAVVEPASTVQVNTIAATSMYSDPFAKKTFDLINAERAKVGARPFIWNQRIADVSQEWATHLGIVTKDPNWDFSTIHRPDAGGSLIPSGATMYRENVGFNRTPELLVQWWMNSPGHKAAMLDPRLTDAGLGYVYQTSGPYAGLYQMVSNMAAYPSSVPAPAPTPVTTGNVLNTIDTSGNLWGYNAPGNTSLGGRGLLGSGWGTAKQILSVDWNSDGILDIVARWNNGYVTMYAGTGNNSYRAPINIGSGGWQDIDITATKFRNSDAYPGLIARDTVSGNLFYYPNSNGGAMTTPRIQIGFGGWTPMTEINALDWDGDGDKNMDLIVRNPNGELMLYRSNGAGTILNEPRKAVDWGWNVMDSISAEPNFAGPGTVGFIARTTSGMLYYYPIIGGKVQRSTLIGNGGWSGYKISAGTPTIAR